MVLKFILAILISIIILLCNGQICPATISCGACVPSSGCGYCPATEECLHGNANGP